MRIPVSLPWHFDEHPLETVTIPLLGLGALLGFMACVLLPMPGSYPEMGLGYWYTAAVFLLTMAAYASTCLYAGLRLPIDVKALEFLYLNGGLLAILYLSRYFDPFGRFGLRLFIGMALGLSAWWVSTVMAWACSRTLPPPDEGLLGEQAGKGALEHLMGSRLDRTLYRRLEEGAAHAGYLKFLRQLIVLAFISAVANVQYGQVRETPWAGIASTVGLAVFVFCGLSLSAVLSMKSKRVADEARGTIILGNEPIRQVRYIQGFVAMLVLVAVSVPARVSPIAMVNLDRISTLMGRLIHFIFRGIYGDAPYRPVNDGHMRAGRAIDSAIPVPSAQGGNVLDYLTVFMIAAIVVSVVLSVRHARRRNREVMGILAYGKPKDPLAMRLVRGLSSFGRRVLGFPASILSALAHWFSFMLLPAPAPDTGDTQVPRGFRGFLRRLGRRTMDILLPNQPGALIRALYGRLLVLGRRYGAERAGSMTADEYAKMLMDRAKASDPETVLALSRELGILTSAYVDTKYTPRVPGKPLAERAMNALKSLQSYFKRGAVRGTRSTTVEGARGPRRSAPGDGTGGFRL